MLTLSQDDILLGCEAPDWRGALDCAAEALQQAGLVAAGYRDGLHAREAQSSTFLGSAIAIPHGTPESREHVRATGVRVLQFPRGIDWHDGNRVHVLVTIAARSDAHLDILRQLTHVLDREGVVERLAAADSRTEIAGLLSKAVVEARLDTGTLCLGFPARDASELALAAAARLRQAGCAESTFVAAVANQAPHDLGQGLWLVSSARGVTRPALALATPESLLTHGDSPLVGVFCLAAQGDAHRGLLERLLTLLESGSAGDLAGADAATVLTRLAGESAAASTRRVRVLNAHGLHARPAKQLVQVARAQSVAIRVHLEEGGGQAVSATSLTKVIGLGARRGQPLVFSAEGEGTEAALDAVCRAVTEGLGESVLPFDESREHHLSDTQAMIEPLPENAPQAAVAASPGLAIAPAFVLRLPRFDYPQRADDPAVENRRLDEAMGEGAEQLEALVRQARGCEVAQILSMHEAMLTDPELHQAAREDIGEGASAEAAWWHAIETAAHAQEMLADRLLAERAADLRDVGRRVLGLLCRIELPEPPDIPYILVADDLGPSDVARLDTARVRGLLTARGGATDHSAILARALGIPAAVGAGKRVLRLANDTLLILDGDRGRFTVAPSEERLAAAEQRLADQHHREAEAWEARHRTATTRDGHRVEVAANLGNTAHALDAVERGAEGVGLLRTEFLFMAHASAPNLATQVEEYREALDALDGRPLVARTLDVGGDKPLPYWPMPKEDNPFLGLRGIRLSLTRPEMLETQLRALLMAAAPAAEPEQAPAAGVKPAPAAAVNKNARPLRIMLPMVKDVGEFRTVRALLDRLLEELPQAERATDVQLGVMIEVPSAALLAPTLAAEVDFFSVGTNDLTQYALAIDRGHPDLAAQSDGLHPAVLRLIEMTVAAAHARGKWVGVCGELASDATAVPVLVGLGVDELSVSARQVPLVKARLREFDLAEARAQATLALAQSTAEAVRDVLETG
ncbi:fused PTS fructose transporter subunit IIA/HPr protein [Halomonas sp. RA08-2]|uniref:fused PTS fructose transporter subunit IIA/HPr protein n=1 Tax=Halomonas sp. RA08-2 TaxID=3440842 RepID=UPI003EE89B34